MSADRVNATTAEHSSEQIVSATEKAILRLLTRVPEVAAADGTGLAEAELIAAARIYRKAGRAALRAHQKNGGWHQVAITFPDTRTAEKTTTSHLLPFLCSAKDQGMVTLWWYIRKSPTWRLRVQAPDATTEHVETHLHTHLDQFQTAHLIGGWYPGIYEPETFAFGGSAAMTTAHQLFHADSEAVLTHLHSASSKPVTPSIGKRELSIMLCSALLGAAGQDWYEQGDVWHRVARLRPLAADAPHRRSRAASTDITRLMALDTRPTSPLMTDGPLTPAKSWFNAFTEAGAALADAARQGTLERGIRDILAHHLIYHWNRIGLRDDVQSVLAHTAHEAVFRAQSGPNSEGRDDVA
jgi:thiopeptide-type bacteriocin biosynthesis protein